MRYFEPFPTLDYNDYRVKNILARVKLLEKAKSTRSLYHPFTVLDGEDPRKIAYDYYGSTDYTWLIFIVNDIIDPYYDWPLSTVEFEAHIKKKYGSFQAAQEEILYYRKTPDEYYLSLTNPNVFVKKELFSGDASGYRLVTQDTIDITISPETYDRNPDADYSPVDAFSWEVDRNEDRRNIRLLDRAYASSMDKELKTLLAA